MRYLIMGAGALGSVFGGFLAKAGHDVSFVGRDAHLRALRQGGLSLTGLWGEHHLDGLQAYEGAQGLRGVFDVVLLAVKSHITAAASREVLPFLRPDSLVVSMQNGLGNWELIAENVGWERTLGARVIFGAEIVRPGLARVSVYADKVLIGSPTAQISPERIRPIADDLDAAGIPTAICDDIETQLWGKVLYNCALNALGAVLDVPYGFLAEVAQIREAMRLVIDEVFAVAAAKGVRLAFGSAQAYFERFMTVLLPPTAAHHSSMVQDIRAGRPTEIDALNGAICRYGRQCGIATPANTLITALIKGLERKSAV